MSLHQTVEMVRITIDVVEAQVDQLAAPGGEAELREAVLRYTREVAFGAAQVYARTAEARGAWDARLEALVVDSLVRGEAGEGLRSWAAALNWSSSPVAVIAGTADDGESAGIIEDLRAIARRSRLDLLAGVHGSRLVVVLGGSADPFTAAQQLAGRFGPGPVVVGHAVADLHSRRPVGGRRAGRAAGGAGPGRTRRARCWPPNCCRNAPWTATRRPAPNCSPTSTSPCCSGGAALVETVTTYLEQGFSLEAAARLLFVHPNTVRYRLRRVE